ncbi:MAG: ABC transporter ATP-binding protein [Gemmatimonadetes bacterium]|nr:ABC transporter ATP-binding protein [Gemmatimonadota bacterium]
MKAPAPTSTGDDPLRTVRVEGLARHFGSLEAVRDLSFSVEGGELFGIVGPDGAGKTTLLRMLAGVLAPTRGDAWIGGLSVVRDPEAVKHRIAYMAQRFGLYEDLTVRENLDFYGALYGVGRREFEERLERLHRFSGLGPFESRLAGALSGGMKQKLALSCCLVHRPDVLLLDEPTFGVDPISRRDLWLILHEMVNEGVTIVVSTAYMDEAERFDRVALLAGGEVLALDRPEELRRRSPGPVRVLATSAPRRARDVLRATDSVVSATLFGEAVHVVVDPESRGADLKSALARAGIPVLEDREEEPSLEDVFIALVEASGPARETANR